MLCAVYYTKSTVHHFWLLSKLNKFFDNWNFVLSLSFHFFSSLVGILPWHVSHVWTTPETLDYRFFLNDILRSMNSHSHSRTQSQFTIRRRKQLQKNSFPSLLFMWYVWSALITQTHAHSHLNIPHVYDTYVHKCF